MSMNHDNAFEIHHHTEEMETSKLDFEVHKSTPIVDQPGLCGSKRHGQFQRGVFFL